ncbi:hypothetical protein DFH06DRAFT_1236715 [Mycena polygramma]|nr:hypothetical protein DFH06DRAFT_1236715 [Mycena polygramma]
MIPLPPELIVSIAALIDDSKSLKACSLACRGLVAPAQRILLRTLRIQQIGSGRWQNGTAPHGVLSIQRAHTVLHASPHISSYIRHLTLRFAGPPLNADEQRPLQDILSALGEIEDLVICGSVSAPHNPFTTSLLPNFLAILKVPTLDRMCLRNFQAVPREFLSLAMASARILLLQHVSPMGADLKPPAPDAHGEAPRLERLIFQGKTSTNSLLDFVLDSGNSGSLEHLRTLDVPMAPGAANPMHRMVAATATPLRHLIVDYGGASVFLFLLIFVDVKIGLAPR